MPNLDHEPSAEQLATMQQELAKPVELRLSLADLAAQLGVTEWRAWVWVESLLERMEKSCQT